MRLPSMSDGDVPIFRYLGGLGISTGLVGQSGVVITSSRFVSLSAGTEASPAARRSLSHAH